MYQTGEKSNVNFFVGKEIENTPFINMNTLFVVGKQSLDEIRKHLTFDLEHIYLGANKSFDPDSLTMLALYTRRGGISISPFRTTESDYQWNDYRSYFD